MKLSLALKTTLLLMLVAVMTGCDFLGGIFNAGIGIGVVVTLGAIILIVILIRAFRRRG